MLIRKVNFLDFFDIYKIQGWEQVINFCQELLGFSLKIPPFLRKLITFVKQNTHVLAGIPDKAGSFPTLLDGSWGVLCAHKP